MAYPRCYVLEFAFLCQLVLLLESAPLSFDYNFSAPGVLDNAYLMYLNDSYAAGDRINLTRMNPWSTGRVTYAQPVRLWDDSDTGNGASFKTSFSFAIGGNYNTNRSDGIAFVISAYPPKLPPDSSGWLLGLFNTQYPSRNPPTVAVEFDTYWNHEFDPPGKTDHIGIDIDAIHSTNYTELPLLALYGTMSANVTYDAASKMMVATLLLPDGSGHSVQTPVDFRAAGVPQDASVGFSSSTGIFFEEHQLLSWSFHITDTGGHLPSSPPSPSNSTHAPDPSRNTRAWMKLGNIILIVVAAFVVGVGVAVGAGAAGKWHARCRKRILLPAPREFQYCELRKATNNFRTKLGAGAFGEVYSGELRDQQKVAVKKLTWPVVWTDYVNEIMILGNLGHRNVVKLLGWCCRDQNPISNILSRCFGAGSDELYLVYELVSNKSVFEHLHGEHKLLPWQERYNIALGIGAAIIYLHTGCEKPILHRDIKPSNVMLDDNFVPKLGDFGLVRQLRTGRSELTGTGMIGTRAYMDPEVQNSNSATTASDMYSFGVLLLELATGTQPTVSQGPGPGALLNGIRRSYHRGEVLTMADRRLEGKFDKIQMQRVLVVGLLCTQQGNHRPDIRKAVNYLSNLDHPVPEVISVV